MFSDFPPKFETTRQKQTRVLILVRYRLMLMIVHKTQIVKKQKQDGRDAIFS